MATLPVCGAACHNIAISLCHKNPNNEVINNMKTDTPVSWNIPIIKNTQNCLQWFTLKVGSLRPVETSTTAVSWYGFTTQKSSVFKEGTWQTQNCSLMPEYFIRYCHQLLWMSCSVVTEWGCKLVEYLGGVYLSLRCYINRKVVFIG